MEEPSLLAGPPPHQHDHPPHQPQHPRTSGAHLQRAPEVINQSINQSINFNQSYQFK